MNYVLDSSFCGAFIMPDERSQRTSDFFETISEDSTLYVPSLFWFEISNLLVSAIKRKRINKPDVFSLLELLPKSKLNTDIVFGIEYANTVTALAAEYDLSSYDASYLELGCGLKKMKAIILAKMITRMVIVVKCSLLCRGKCIMKWR